MPYDGLVPDTPENGHLLVLTNQRFISFIQSDGTKETILASLDELKGVSVKAATKGLKNLSQGLIIILAGIMSYFIIGYILDGITIAAALGAAIMFVGALFIAKYFFWGDEGSVTFRGSSIELSFPYRSTMASSDVYRLVNRFFQLKLNSNTHHTSPPLALEEDTSEPPSSFTPGAPGTTGDSSYHI